jgi:hypothetical protein
MPEIEPISPNAWFRMRRWLSDRLATADRHNQSGKSKLKRGRASLGLAVSMLFCLAIGVRSLYWQDSTAQILGGEMPLHGLTSLYRDQATQMLEQGLFFPSAAVDPADGRLISHPPGYPILIASVLRVFGEPDTTLRIIQILMDAGAAILIFLIALELFPFAAAVIAGSLAALSPHFAYYSILLLPDSMSALPILLAVYAIIRVKTKLGFSRAIAAGALIGVSCWLRSNALMLAPFVAVAVFVVFERARRARYGVALVGAAILVVAPITIRNWIVYHRFIPISLGAGITLMQGIADYDKGGRFGLPLTDEQTAEQEAERYGRPDYARHLWAPDGIDRDHHRFARGLSIVGENPGWFLTVMLRRMGFMLRYNDFRRQNIPYNSTLAPTVSASPAFGHGLVIPDGAAATWAARPPDFFGKDTVLSPEAKIDLVDSGNSVQVSGSAGVVFTSAPIAVEKNTDHILSISLFLDQGAVSVKVQAADEPRIVLAVLDLTQRDKKAIRQARKMSELETDAPAKQMRTEVQAPFATGNVSEVRLVISSGGMVGRKTVTIDRAEIFMIGTTPGLWTHSPRQVVGAIQKNVYNTDRLLLLIVFGIGILAVSRRGFALVILLIVPSYYLLVQSAFHTEYRYILAIHYFLFIIAAVTLYCTGAAIRESSLWAIRKLRWN